MAPNGVIGPAHEVYSRLSTMSLFTLPPRKRVTDYLMNDWVSANVQIEQSSLGIIATKKIGLNTNELGRFSNIKNNHMLGTQKLKNLCYFSTLISSLRARLKSLISHWESVLRVRSGGKWMKPAGVSRPFFWQYSRQRYMI